LNLLDVDNTLPGAYGWPTRGSRAAGWGCTAARLGAEKAADLTRPRLGSAGRRSDDFRRFKGGHLAADEPHSRRAFPVRRRRRFAASEIWVRPGPHGGCASRSGRLRLAACCQIIATHNHRLYARRKQPPTDQQRAIALCSLQHADCSWWSDKVGLPHSCALLSFRVEVHTWSCGLATIGWRHHSDKSCTMVPEGEVASCNW
jgi:hypothetical protein